MIGAVEPPDHIVEASKEMSEPLPPDEEEAELLASHKPEEN